MTLKQDLETTPNHAREQEVLSRNRAIKAAKRQQKNISY